MRNTMKTLRVTYSDPYATDDSSDEETTRIIGPKPVKRVVLKIPIAKRVVGNNKKQVKGKKPDSKGGKGKKPDRKKRKENKFPGCRQRKWGNWAAEIRDPFLKIRIWLGTFKDAEQASAAYQAKKAEFEERKRRAAAVSPSSVLDNVGESSG